MLVAVHLAYGFQPGAPLLNPRPALRTRGAHAAVAMNIDPLSGTTLHPAGSGVLGTRVEDPGPATLTGDRDACGVGFLADQKGRRRHDIMQRALHALGCMEHRGGCGGDRISGDGAGVMTSVPWELFEAEGVLQGKPSESCGVAQIFLPTDEAERLQVEASLAKQAERRGIEVLGWRVVPQKKDILGPMALDALPDIRQAFLHHPTLRGDELEEELYQTRRSVQADVSEMAAVAPAGSAIGATYIASLSSRTIVYKGMVQSAVLGPFYTDLTDERYFTNFAIYHRRFSTNTVPKWPLAQPMRCLAHNGEINTLLGNVNWQRALDAVRERRDPLCSLDRSVCPRPRGDLRPPAPARSLLASRGGWAACRCRAALLGSLALPLTRSRAPLARDRTRPTSTRSSST